jgi:hypothetical protein
MDIQSQGQSVGSSLRMLAAAILLVAGCGNALADTDISEAVLARAIEAYKAGDIDPAIGGINAALRGRLSTESTAKAYYYRGLAHRKANLPGQAISDLTLALQYSDLTEPDRSNASENLSVAYDEAGIAPNEKVVVVKPSNAGERRNVATTVASRGPSATALATASVAKPGVPQSGSEGPEPAVQARSPPASDKAKAGGADPTAARSTAWVSQQVALSPLPTAPVLPTKKPTLPAVAAKPKTSTGRLPVAVAVVAPFTTEVSVAPNEDVVNSNAAGAEMRLLVGDTTTRSEAFALAIRLTSQRGSTLGPRRPQVVSGAIGDTVSYRLRLGPFADAGQAMSLCQSLRDSGFACVPE